MKTPQDLIFNGSACSVLFAGPQNHLSCIPGLLQNEEFKSYKKNIVSCAEKARDLLSLLKPTILLIDISYDPSFEELITYTNVYSPATSIIAIIDHQHADIEKILGMGAADILFKENLTAPSLQQSILINCIKKKKATAVVKKRIDSKLISLSDAPGLEAYFNFMFQKNPFPTWIYDTKTFQFLDVNRAAILKYGFSRNEFLQMSILDIRPENGKDELEKFLKEYPFAESVHKSTWPHRTKKNELLFVEITSYPVHYGGHKAKLVQVNDITEQKKLRDELQAVEKKRQHEILHAVMKAQEKERTAIAKELHDNVNQILVSAKLYAEVSTVPGQANYPLIQKSVQLVNAGIEEIRKLSKELITPEFEENGLTNAIKELGELVSKANNTRMRISTKQFSESHLSNDVKINIYRIIQEQVNNIIKHAGASLVHLTLSQDKQHIRLKITDNGKGFDPEKKSKGIGLSNIRSRVSMLHGTMQLDTKPGAGCRLEVQFPNTCCNLQANAMQKNVTRSITGHK